MIGRVWTYGNLHLIKIYCPLFQNNLYIYILSKFNEPPTNPSMILRPTAIGVVLDEIIIITVIN